jgi:AGZA family xanthine/uracil permease-like MFS transporter
MDKGAVFVATCVAAAISSVVMGLVANYPIALAPGMGLNAFFAFTVVLTNGYSWQQALAGVFCSGVIFLLISLGRIREYLINSIPKNLKLAISTGVGLFLGIIALEEAKIVVAQPQTLVTLGDLKAWPAVLCLVGFAVIVGLNRRGIIGATLIGMAVITLAGIPLGIAEFTGVVAAPPSLAPTLLQLDISRAAEVTFVIVVFSFLLVDVFDNAGTLIGVAHAARLLDAQGHLPRMREALMADSFAAMLGALIGTSTTTSFIESAAGVAAGGRTGLTAIFVGLFFVLALFFSPLAAMIPAYASAAALLCGLHHDAGAGRDRMAGHHRVRSRGGHRPDDAAHLFDRKWNRPRLHHVRARQDSCRQISGHQSAGHCARGRLRNQVRPPRLGPVFS